MLARLCSCFVFIARNIGEVSLHRPHQIAMPLEHIKLGATLAVEDTDGEVAAPTYNPAAVVLNACYAFGMPAERLDVVASRNVPEHTRAISRSGDDFIVVYLNGIHSGLVTLECHENGIAC